METYKIGNKVKCIVRSLVPCTIGTTEMKYGNQPYTILNDIDASLHFTTAGSAARVQRTAQLAYSMDNVSGVKLSNVTLNKRILDLIFDIKPQEEVLCNSSVNMDVEPGEPLELSYLVNQHGAIYQVFIYNADAELVAAQGSIDKSNFTIDVGPDGGNFLVFYSHEGQMGYALERTGGVYLSLDLEVDGNESDDLNTYYIHLHRCSLSVSKNLYFHGGINNIDLDFAVIPSEEDYITIK